MNGIPEAQMSGNVRSASRIIGTEKSVKKTNLIGQKFGRLMVIDSNGLLSNGKTFLTAWLCICDCGNTTTVRSHCLLSGKTKSCGCLSKEVTRIRSISHGLSKHYLYKIWADIKKRTNGKGTRFYDGVTLDPKWNSFEPFYEWAISRWKRGLVIDRKNTLEGYSETNCRFVTSKENNQNSKRSKIWVVYGKQFNSAYDAALFYGCSNSHIVAICQGRKYLKYTYYPEAFCYVVKRYGNNN